MTFQTGRDEMDSYDKWREYQRTDPNYIKHEQEQTKFYNLCKRYILAVDDYNRANQSDDPDRVMNAYEDTLEPYEDMLFDYIRNESGI